MSERISNSRRDAFRLGSRMLHQEGSARHTNLYVALTCCIVDFVILFISFHFYESNTMAAVPKIPPLEIDVWYFIKYFWIHIKALFGWLYEEISKLCGSSVFRRSSLKGVFNNMNDSRTPQVVIMGAGFGGICAGIFLDLIGLPYIILERYENLGGVWWENTYPGCACDVMSFLYSFSFDINPPWCWSNSFAFQSENQKYLDYICKKYKVVDKIRFSSFHLNSKVKEVSL